jgi:hypothetical protein
VDLFHSFFDLFHILSSCFYYYRELTGFIDITFPPENRRDGENVRAGSETLLDDNTSDLARFWQIPGGYIYY